MTVTLTQQEQISALIEYSEIMGFLLAFEEGATSSERANSLAKKFPAITKIRDQIRCGRIDEDVKPQPEKPVKVNGKKKPEPAITE